MLKNRVIYFVIFDTLCIAISLFLSFVVRFEGIIPAVYIHNLPWFLVLFILVKLTLYFFLDLYSLSWLYIGLSDIILVAKSVFYSLVVIGIAILLLNDNPVFKGFPRSILFIDSFISFLSISGWRLFFRIKDGLRGRHNLSGEKILIIGAGNAGEQLLRSILSLRECKYLPVGFIDDDKFKKGTSIHGVRVLGMRSEIKAIARRHNIKTIIIAMPSAHGGIIKETVDFARKAGIVNIKILPQLSELIDGRVGVLLIKDINPEDILGRRLDKPDFSKVVSGIKEKSVLITGAAGSIGSEICRQIVKFPLKSLIMLDQDETGIFNIHSKLKEDSQNLNVIPLVANIRDVAKINSVFSKLKPDIVFHAAAYKHVPVMEEYPEEAVKTNVLGTLILAEAAEKYDTKTFVLISTDKAVKPSSVMGATKRIAEMIIDEFSEKTHKRFLAVRFGNVLESRGNAFEIFKKQIMERREVTLTSPNMKRYVMSISEAVSLVLQSAFMDESGIFIMDMGKEIDMIDFVKQLIYLSGFEPDKDIPIVFRGKRPGEKEREELVAPGELKEATKYKNIFIVKHKPEKLLLTGAGIYIDRLRELAAAGASKEEFAGIFHKIIPDYQG